jgi:hypothetical protein
VTTPAVRTFLFDSTNAALWAEEVAKEEGIPVEVVPAPAESDAKCDLAIITPEDHVPLLRAALTAQGVPFRPWRPG